MAGVASQGTRLMATFASVPNGVQLWVPVLVHLYVPASGPNSGWAVLLAATDQNGNGGFSGATGNGGTPTGSAYAVGGGSAGLAQVSLLNGAGIVVYEILYDDPFNIERLDVPLYVAYVANQGNNLPAPNVQATAALSFAPISTVGTADPTAPIPRFVPGTPANAFIINKCQCNLLFPFVTNQQGFDTGIAISNTSLDIYGTTPQQGVIRLNYFSAGTPPPQQTTNAVVPAGQTLTFTLSGGGNFGITATPGFQGYIIAQSDFQYCHAFAYVSAQGALPTAPGASEGYLGIVLDAPSGVIGWFNRTGQIGEMQAH